MVDAGWLLMRATTAEMVAALCCLGVQKAVCILKLGNRFTSAQLNATRGAGKRRRSWLPIAATSAWAVLMVPVVILSILCSDGLYLAQICKECVDGLVLENCHPGGFPILSMCGSIGKRSCSDVTCVSAAWVEPPTTTSPSSAPFASPAVIAAHSVVTAVADALPFTTSEPLIKLNVQNLSATPIFFSDMVHPRHSSFEGAGYNDSPVTATQYGNVFTAALEVITELANTGDKVCILGVPKSTTSYCKFDSGSSL